MSSTRVAAGGGTTVMVYGTRHKTGTGLRIRSLETGAERWLAAFVVVSGLGALNGFVRLAHRFHIQFVEVRTAFLGVQDVG